MLYYLGTYYSDYIKDRNPSGSRAENYKMEYIISAIKRAGYSLSVVSAIGYLKGGFNKTVEFTVDNNEKHIYLGNYTLQRPILSKIGVFTRLVILFFFLFLHVNKNDTVIVYNTPIFSSSVRLAKWLKKFKLIVQIEELFYFEKSNLKAVKNEIREKKLIESAEKYIVANEFIYKEVCNSKPGVVVYGPYFSQEKVEERFADGLIHIIYGGGNDHLRRVDLAASAMDYLDDSYCFDVFAFGSAQAMNTVKEIAKSINKKSKFDKITLHDPLSGSAFTSFLQKCHIGLNLQSIGSEFDEMAFPSKISTYLGCGLNVVSSSLKSIRNSKISAKVTYYEHDNAESIADAIKRCEIKSYEENTKIMAYLDGEFVEEIKLLLGEI